jgi:hypothetical protein
VEAKAAKEEEAEQRTRECSGFVKTGCCSKSCANCGAISREACGGDRNEQEQEAERQRRAAEAKVQAAAEAKAAKEEEAERQRMAIWIAQGRPKAECVVS